MRGSLVKFRATDALSGVITELKNTSGSTFSTPSATPVDLLNERKRPLIATMYWLGPMVPIESGGNAPPVSESVAPVKLVLIACGESDSPGAALTGVAAGRSEE